MVPGPVAERTSFGRYEIVRPLATGGMGTVYLGRMRAARGVSLTVAIKRINAALAGDPRATAMFVDEARITSLVRHPNVVQTLDVVEEDGELLLVMEYVHGVSLAHLLAAAQTQGERLPTAILARIASDVLHGLQAVHEATSEQGKSLEIVHRDVSPQNVLVGVDGIARVADFGIARAADRLETTKNGEVRGKLRYIAPEQFAHDAVDRRADIYGVGLVLWEMIVGSAMRRASSPGGLTAAILAPRLEPPSSFVPDVPPALDELVLRALAHDPRERFAFASQMAVALEAAVTPAPYATVAEVVRELGREEIGARKRLLDRSSSTPGSVPPASGPAPIAGKTASQGGATSGPATLEPDAGAATAQPPVPAVARVGRRGRVTALVAGGALLLAAIALFPRYAPSAHETTTSESPSAAPSAVALASPPAPPPTVASAPLAATPSDVPPLAPHAGPARKGTRPTSGRAAPAKPNCAIPYVIDRSGIRVPRPECM